MLCSSYYPVPPPPPPHTHKHTHTHPGKAAREVEAAVRRQRKQIKHSARATPPLPGGSERRLSSWSSRRRGRGSSRTRRMRRRRTWSGYCLVAYWTHSPYLCPCISTPGGGGTHPQELGGRLRPEAGVLCPGAGL